MHPARLIRFGLKVLAGWELRGVGLNLTRRCNLRCRYCRVIRRPDVGQEHELSPAQWTTIIDRFVACRRAHFIFTGGEPLLYRGLDRLVRHASGRALTSLISNATLLDEAAFDRLRHLDFLTFSFDTLDPHRSGLPKAPADRLPLIAEQCARHHITPSAIVLISAKNINEVPDIIRLLDKNRITSLLSLVHADAGEGQPWDFRHCVPDLQLDRGAGLARLRRLQRELLAMQRDGLRIAESERFIGGMVDYVQGRFRVDCPAADPFLTVDCDGRIKACHDTPASEVSALRFADYRAMLAEVRRTVRPGCNCYYDCYVDGRNSPLQNALRGLRRGRLRPHRISK